MKNLVLCIGLLFGSVMLWGQQQNGNFSIDPITFGENTQIKKQTNREDLESGIVIGTPSLPLAGIKISSYMEGKNMFDSNFKRDYIITYFLRST